MNVSRKTLYNSNLAVLFNDFRYTSSVKLNYEEMQKNKYLKQINILKDGGNIY